MFDLAWQTWVAFYAAIVATGALFLEVRRWFDSKPRLVVSVSQNMKTIGLGDADGSSYLVATVVNRGGFPTTITNMGMIQFSSWIQKIRRKVAYQAVVANPSGIYAGPRIPYLIKSGEQWIGMGRYDDVLREFAARGKFYVAVYATDRDSPRLCAVKIKLSDFDKRED